MSHWILNASGLVVPSDLLVHETIAREEINHLRAEVARLESLTVARGNHILELQATLADERRRGEGSKLRNEIDKQRRSIEALKARLGEER